MLKQNKFQCKKEKSGEKVNFFCVGNVDKCKKYLGGREKFKMNCGMDCSEERGLPGLNSFKKNEKNSWVDAENVNKDESLYKVINLSHFRKFANFVTGRKKGQLYKTDRLPYLSKQNYKFFQFVIDEILDEDNEDFEPAKNSFWQTPVLSSRQNSRKERHGSIV